MRYLLALLLLTAPVQASAFSTVSEFQKDFSAAKSCRPIDGRQVWKGKQAFYIQSWLLNQPGQVDPEAVSAVALKDNSPEDLKPFVEACK
ncbi:MAG TPA: hypothetical protein VN667_08960 [Burkholderiales bacterium]|nr:hypothetical protein [Burkholderiales bacterium]